MARQHVTFEVVGTVGVIALDYAGKSANVLSQEMLAELAESLIIAEQTPDLTGVIIRSSKPSGFVFGADITEFERLQSAEEVRALQQVAMTFLDQLAASDLVSVAILHGPALGGGLELALACDYRIALSDQRIMAGFPEANLGLMPGFAGTARAARLMGATACLELCLSAKPLTRHDGLQTAGLIDVICEGAGSQAQAEALIKQGKRSFDAQEMMPVSPSQIDALEARYLAGRPSDHVPHLQAILTHFAKYGADYQGLVDGELHQFPKLMMGDVSDGLRRVFALTDAVKKQAKGRSGISEIQVIGAGAMGADIATYLCVRGMNVTLTDISETALGKAKSHADAYFDRKLDDAGAQAAKARLSYGTALSEPAKIDLVIEAAPEKLGLKQQIWQAVEQSHRADCLFATNSSALDLDQIAGTMSAPDRLLGLHFFNPATVMPLIEVIHRPANKAEDVSQLMRLSAEVGKLPIQVQNSPGFLVNRALLPYIFAAIAAWCQGEVADEIDQALLGFGMPMGPLELADQIGLDICYDVGERLGMPDCVKSYLGKQIAQGQLGRKTGSGIYDWDGKKALRARADYDEGKAEALITQILAPLYRECEAALAEGHVQSREFVDAAMIYGTGFPRHTGGPLYHHHKTAASNS